MDTRQEPDLGGYYARDEQSQSDKRIHANVCMHLNERRDVEASAINVSVADGNVTLTGAVNSGVQKRLAEEVARACSGGRDVRNELTITDREVHIGKASE